MTSPFTVWACTLVTVGAGLLVTGRQAWSAGVALRSARTEHARTIKLVGELRQLRAGQQAGMVSGLAASALPPRISATLASCGLDAEVLTGFSSAAAASPGHSDQTATLVLEPITLRQLGRFLGTWRTAEPGWTVTGIDIAPSTRGHADGDLGLRAVLRMEAAVAEGGAG